jgi:hypothetical protein
MKKSMSARPTKTKSVSRQVAEDAWIDPSKLGVSERAFFKPEENKTFRIHLMAVPTRAHVQYIPGLGYIKSLSTYKMENGAEVLDEAGLDVELLNREPMLMWCVPVLVYSTNTKGVLTTKDPSEIEYEFKLWSFYAADYRKLYQMAAEYGDDFLNKDLLVSGVKRGKWINAEFTVSAQNAACLNSKIKAQVESEFRAYKFKDAKEFIARTVTEDELRTAIEAIDEQANSGAED